MKRLDFRFWALVPAWGVMTVGLILPILVMVAVSFGTRGPYGGFLFGFSFDGYRQILFSTGWTGGISFDPQYLVIVGRTIALAAFTTLISMFLSLPVAYYIARLDPRKKSLLIYLVTLPFWVSMIVRVYAWTIILGNGGVIDKVVTFLGFGPSPGGFLYSDGAMLTGMIYSYIPLMILPVFASIERLDPTLIEASHDLYGNRWVTLRRVIIPGTWPGLMAGAILVFVPCLGAVLEPVILGGGKVLMMGNLIGNQFGEARNWPFGAAMAMVLLALVMIVLTLDGLRASKRQLAEAAAI
jgi:spermidine/putrescine transport system permease protein